MQSWVNMFASYILWLMMVYLTDVWGLELVHAAGTINIWMGLIKILPIVFAHLADAYLGNFLVVLFSSLSSMIVSHYFYSSTTTLHYPFYSNKVAIKFHYIYTKDTILWLKIHYEWTNLSLSFACKALNGCLPSSYDGIIRRRQTPCN